MKKSSAAQIVESLFGSPLSVAVIAEAFGGPVDNTRTRVGLEDERDEADQAVRNGTWWSEFDRWKKKP